MNIVNTMIRRSRHCRRHVEAACLPQGLGLAANNAAAAIAVIMGAADGTVHCERS